ncbi:FAD-binding domain protein [Aspergillus sclerotioniger CBS 115572]|uniref:FAD-binding domain protein n=1 Tax=Aspergillus sclerotioniger CBS 115572 TaxID=1450535 RepID=A0A317XCI2_9EURO|nr:FAD-binding domain protein [Aspergillus sclerotioniger CBS 115572]PWY96035.1 FAD-binding domain protein [Aspergillus sclerotioniger CBS 115572]
MLLYLSWRIFLNCYFTYIRPWWLVHVAYSSLRPTFWDIKIILKPQFLGPIAYFAGTAVFNIIGVNSISEAGIRAARLSIFTLLLLFWAGDHEYGARLLGVSLGTYQYIHRISAIMAVLQGTIHVVIKGQEMHFSASNTVQFYGLMVRSMFLVLLLFPLVKRRVYEIFLKIHQGCAIFTLYSIWRHVNASYTRYWVYLLTATFTTTAILQVSRIIFRNISRGKKSTRFVTQSCGDGMIRVTLLLPRPWTIRAGERVNINIPGLGFRYTFQSHPFSIAWWEEDTSGRVQSISLLIRARSGFTRKLIDYSTSSIQQRAWIDGPFGPSSVSSIGPLGVGDYSHVFMVTTGIGIAAQLPYIKELLSETRKGRTRTRKISLVWQLQREGDWEGARDWLQDLVEQDNGCMLNVTIYDQLESPSKVPHTVGHHELITTYCGNVDWKEQLLNELEHQVGQLLVAGTVTS